VPNTPIWTFADVGVGMHWVSFDVRVSGSVVGVAFILNTVSLNYSDEKGYLWPTEIATRDVVLNGPVIALMTALKGSRVELLKYASSGDVAPMPDVVGYASMAVRGSPR